MAKKRKSSMSGSPGYGRTSIAAMVVVRIFLGLFFCYSAAAKLFLPADPSATVAPSAFNADASADVTTVVQPPQASMPTVTTTKDVSIEPFVAELKQDTAPDGRFVAQNVWPACAGLLPRYVYPHARLFAWLILVGEALVGLLLLIGLLTRPAALGALLLSAVYLLATMHLSSMALAANAGFFAMALAVLISGPGHTLGVDALFGPKSPASAA